MEAKDSNGVQSKPSPVACMTVARRRLFCGSGNDVIVLQFNTDGKPEVERRWSVEDANRNLVLNIVVGSFVWVSTRDSTLVDTWEPAKGVYHGAVDCKTILERSGVTEASHDVRVLSLLLQQKKRQLWIGLGSGHVILINPSTKEPLRIIRRHVSAVRCMEACCGPAFGKPLSLVMTGGMGFIERPSGSQNKANADFGHVLIWEADVRAQIDFLDSYKKKREEYVSSSQHSARESSPGPRERSYTVDLIDNQCQSLFHLRRKSMI